MNSWSVLFIALAAVVLQAWVSRRGAPGWYMGCIIPLLYGAAVAWMFVCLLYTSPSPRDA